MSTPQHTHNDMKVPPAMLYMIGGLILVVLALVGLSQLTGIGQQKDAAFDTVNTRMLRFDDTPDGGIAVYDHATDALLFTYTDGDDGFVRTALRAMAFDRARAEVGREAPFRLMRTYRDHLVLEDPATGNLVTLAAFGARNEANFARLLDREGAPG